MLLIEIFDSCSTYLSLLAGAYYCATDAPDGMLGSLNGMVTAAVFGAGTLKKKVISCRISNEADILKEEE